MPDSRRPHATIKRTSTRLPPHGFTRSVAATGPKSGLLNFTLALVSQNISGLHATLLDVSDPASANYGKHLSKSEVAQFVAPKLESTQAVTSWLKSHGITLTSQSPAGDMLRIQIPLAKANQIFNANFSAYVHDATDATMWRTMTYGVDDSVADHLSFVYPTTQFIPPPTRNITVKAIGRSPTVTRAGSKRDAATECAKGVTPSCLQALYNIPAAPATASKNSLVVSGFDGEVANKTDLKSFLLQERPDFTTGDFVVQAIDGGSTTGQGTTEASLDIQYTVGVATNVATTFVSVGTDNDDGCLAGFLDLVQMLMNMEDPPLVLTTSYAFDESSFQDEPEIAQKLCNAYAQLGLRGTSVLFAAGDGGVSGADSNTNCNGAPFVPTFPATCPYVTVVGSTQGISPETAAPFSAGGFSNIFARLDYQKDAIDTYLKQIGNMNASLFNATGRGYPDVSAQGINFLVTVAGEQKSVSGTSASSPTFAAVIALLNDKRLNAGQSSLGFLNPFLYSNGVAALNDITSGSNPGCGTEGFPALTGWDAVTGLGTPDYNKLLAAVGGGTTVTTGIAATGVSSTATHASSAGTIGTTATSTSSTATQASSTGTIGTMATSTSSTGTITSGSTSASRPSSVALSDPTGATRAKGLEQAFEGGLSTGLGMIQHAVESGLAPLRGLGNL
ncbi:peptidase S8/S53 domain-containing protein [Lenzites betulinus]|nr:peptidase S8/S53 domain-containing protein [Lenzites betulinus]